MAVEKKGDPCRQDGKSNPIRSQHPARSQAMIEAEERGRLAYLTLPDSEAEADDWSNSEEWSG